MYTQWGRTTCPNITGTQHNLCTEVELPEAITITREGVLTTSAYLTIQAIYSTVQATSQTAHIYMEQNTRRENGPLSLVHNHNVPCAVCYVSTRETVLMIPARTTCPSSWTREYNGYLMAAHYAHHRSMHECVDQNPESVSGSVGDASEALFYHVVASCGDGGIACPPYTGGRQLACAVCTI